MYLQHVWKRKMFTQIDQKYKINGQCINVDHLNYVGH